MYNLEIDKDNREEFSLQISQIRGPGRAVGPASKTAGVNPV